jgi:AraC-like DNA-binding protein
LEQAIVLMDKTMMKLLPNRPIAGGTSNNLGLRRYGYWRTGYGSHFLPELDFCVAQAGEYHCKPNYMTGNFEHTYQTQIFYHVSGEAVFEHPGSRTAVASGDLLIIPPYHIFTYSSRWGMKYHWFALEGIWPRVLGDMRVQHRSLNYDAEIEAMLIELREVLILRKPGYPLRSIGVFYELMARIEEISGTSAVPESTYPEAVRNAIIFLRENYAVPFDAAQTADAVGLSQSHLRALFDKWLGESPKQFHTRCRIDQARRLLNEQRLPVVEVAFHVGFTDPHHFSRVFKQVMGVAPSHYNRAKIIQADSSG